ncbi:aminotransferase [Fibrobacterales bacterium]|nr:aminotransferase [Fibrobacterales bacterium]
MLPFYPLKRINNSFEPELSNAILEVAQSGWYLRGERTAKFEREFADYCGVKNCVGVANGLDALTLIFAAYKILGKLKDGDKVCVPANTYIASILAISRNNLEVVLCEPNEKTFNLNLELLTDRTRLTPAPKAILSVNLYGRKASDEVMLKFAKENNILLIEDCAQSAGIKPVGDAAAFSFYPSKNLGALGDAGAVVSNDEELTKLIRELGNYGSKEKYINNYLGVNSRIDELQAAVLSLKLPRLNADNEKRRKIAYRYINEIKNQHIILPIAPENPQDCVWHQFVIRTKERNCLQTYLTEKGIETLIHYPIPPHKQKAYGTHSLAQTSLPITEKLADEVLSLPIHPAMTENEIERVIGLLG